MSKEKTIYDLKLHESIGVDRYINVFRVPGGWIYITFNSLDEDAQVSNVFVPYNEEFREPIKLDVTKHSRNEIEEAISNLNRIHDSMIDESINIPCKEGNDIELFEDLNHIKKAVEILKTHTK